MGFSECGNVDGNRFPCQKRCGEKSPLKGSKMKINHGDPFSFCSEVSEAGQPAHSLSGNGFSEIIRRISIKRNKRFLRFE